MASLSTKISTFAFISRLLIVFIQVLANVLIPDHDAGVFDPPVQNVNSTGLDSIMDFCLGGFRRWDAIYFTHIAQYGYSYENCIAFFPWYPIVVSMFSRILFMIGILHLHHCILFIGIILNCVLFSLTANNLHKLGSEAGLDKISNFLSVIIFCLNPASIFMTAPYSESLYFFLLTLALLYLKRGLTYHASLLIALSVLTRSNGLVGIGFILYSWALNFWGKFSYTQKETDHVQAKKGLFSLLLKDTMKIAICLVICFSPFILYQYYIYTQFCPTSNSSKSIPDYLINYGRLQGFKIQGDLPSPWCFQRFPISYTYIQAKHWGVGFLKYYQLKQIPNFILAAPVVLLSLSACISFCKMNPKAFRNLGLIRTKSDTQQKDSEIMNTRYLLAEQMVVYVFHLAFLTIFGCFFIHIQVLTRLLFSSSPLLYWYAGLILTENPRLTAYLSSQITLETKKTKVKSQDKLQKDVHQDDLSDRKFQRFPFSDVICRRSLNQNIHSSNSYFGIFEKLTYSNLCIKVLIFILNNCSHLTWKSKAILGYCISYCVIGTIMFSNFLPWT